MDERALNKLEAASTKTVKHCEQGACQLKTTQTHSINDEFFQYAESLEEKVEM